MYRLLATDGMAKGGVKTLQDAGFEVVQEFYEPEELGERVKEFDVLVVRSATKVRKPVIDAAVEGGRLKLIIRGGVGVDNIDVDYAREKGIQVNNTPSASSISVAELAIGHMIAAARYLSISNYTMRMGKWEKKAYKGSELYGKTLGLIGLGHNGKETAKRAAALGMRVIYTNRTGHKPENDPFSWCSLDELLERSDFISLHMPAPADKKPVIDRAAIAKMKDGVFLINVARGVLVDEEALLDALDAGKIAAAALDVYRDEPVKNERLYTHEKISMTPHIAASTKEAQERIGDEIARIVLEKFGKS